MHRLTVVAYLQLSRNRAKEAEGTEHDVEHGGLHALQEESGLPVAAHGPADHRHGQALDQEVSVIVDRAALRHHARSDEVRHLLFFNGLQDARQRPVYLLVGVLIACIGDHLEMVVEHEALLRKEGTSDLEDLHVLLVEQVPAP